MTSLFTILTITALIAICWIMAKYNKNDNLFWILLISLFAGMAGGAIFNKLAKASNEEKNVNFEQVYNPTQVSQALGIGFYAEPVDFSAYTASPVSKDVETPVFGIKVNNAPSKVYVEIRGQPLEFISNNSVPMYTNNILAYCRGNPGIPFDTS